VRTVGGAHGAAASSWVTQRPPRREGEGLDTSRRDGVRQLARARSRAGRRKQASGTYNYNSTGLSTIGKRLRPFASPPLDYTAKGLAKRARPDPVLPSSPPPSLNVQQWLQLWASPDRRREVTIAHKGDHAIASTHAQLSVHHTVGERPRWLGAGACLAHLLWLKFDRATSHLPSKIWIFDSLTCRN
jgi:hypothetical protein